MGFTLNQLEQERQIRKLQKKEDKDTSNYEQLSHLPKINDVELKGNKTTSDLGINADNVMMSDGVTSVEDAIGEVSSGLTVKTATVTDERFSNVTVTEVGGVKSLYIATVGNNTALDTTADYVKYFTLPAGFHPANLYYNRFVSKKSATTTDTDWVIRISTNGDVYLFNYSGETHPGFANTFVFI